MKFMVMHKQTPEMDEGLKPDPEIIANVGKLIGEAVKDNAFHGGEGLHPPSSRTHVAYKAGKRVSVTDGPFTEAKELVGGFALMKVKSKDEALKWADRFAEVLGKDLELIMGPVVEPWDLGMMPKPADPPLRILSVMKQDADTENGVTPKPEEFARMGVLIEEMTKAGVLQTTGGLGPTKDGARLRFDGGRRISVMDGPFAESKELIAGYAILDLPSKEVAIEWATRFGGIVKVDEIEVRAFPEW